MTAEPSAYLPSCRIDQKYEDNDPRAEPSDAGCKSRGSGSQAAAASLLARFLRLARLDLAESNWKSAHAGSLAARGKKIALALAADVSRGCWLPTARERKCPAAAAASELGCACSRAGGRRTLPTGGRLIGYGEIADFAPACVRGLFQA